MSSLRPARHQAPFLVTLVTSIGLLCSVSAATFPLPVPTRPTTFPLSRPALGGEVVAWGDNTYGQTSVPPGLVNVVSVSAGAYHSLALRNDGTVVAWGDNRFGQLNVPPTLSGVVAISAGGAHNLALKSDGRVVGWGQNNSGESTVPGTLIDAVAVAAGWGHSLALRSNGQIVGWGENRNGQATPPTVWYDGGSRVATNVVAIGAGSGASLALLSDDRVISWGPHGFEGGTPPRVIVREGLGLHVASIFMGPRGGPLVLRRDGILNRNEYVLYDLPLNLKPVAAQQGSSFTIALNGDGSVTAWGDIPTIVTNVPPRLRSVIAIAAGESHAVIVKLPTPPIPTRATATPQIVNGFVVGLNLIDGGEGYAEPPAVRITGGGGSGATAEAHISRGIVTGFTIINAGRGYTGTPAVEIEPPPILPRLGIATSRVSVTMQVIPGRRYLLESSNDLPNFSPVGQPFVAESDTHVQEFVDSETGQYFRIQEVP